MDEKNRRQAYLDRLLVEHPNPAVSTIIYDDVQRFLDCYTKEAAARPWMTQELFERLERGTVGVSDQLNCLYNTEHYLALMNVPLFSGRALPQPILAYPRLFNCSPDQIVEMVAFHEYRHAEQNAFGLRCGDLVLDHTNYPLWESVSFTLAEVDASIAALKVMRTRPQRTAFYYWSINDINQRAFVLDILRRGSSGAADEPLNRKRQEIISWFYSKTRGLLNDGLMDELDAYRQKHGLREQIPLS